MGILTINEEKKAAVLEIEATAGLKRQKLQSETKQILFDWTAKAQAAKEKIVADADAFIWTKGSEAKLYEVQKSALGKKVVAEAEGTTAEALRLKRTFELQKQQ